MVDLKDHNKTKFEKLFIEYPILKIINDKNHSIIEKSSDFKTLYAGEHISSAKEACNGILFVTSGCINVQRVKEDGDETNLYKINKGEICHEAISCYLEFRSLNILGTALQDSTICIIPISVANQYLFKDGDFLRYVYEDLYHKFNFVIEKKEEKRHESIDNRLIKLLVSKKSKIIYGTHKQLALEIDSSREVISRKLKSWERLGYINIERGKIAILKSLDGLLN